MYIGTQGVPHEDEALEVLSQLGVNNIAQSPTEPWSEWTTDLLVSMREKCASYGINMEMMHLPLSGRVAIPGNLDNPLNENFWLHVCDFLPKIFLLLKSIRWRQKKRILLKVLLQKKHKIPPNNINQNLILMPSQKAL